MKGPGCWARTIWSFHNDRTLDIVERYTGREGELKVHRDLEESEFMHILGMAIQTKGERLHRDGCDGRAWSLRWYENGHIAWKIGPGYTSLSTKFQSLSSLLKEDFNPFD